MRKNTYAQFKQERIYEYLDFLITWRKRFYFDEPAKELVTKHIEEIAELLQPKNISISKSVNEQG